MKIRGPYTNLWGNNNGIHESVEIGAYTEIGDGVMIGAHSVVAAMCFLPPGVVIGQNCFIGPRVTFTNDKMPRAHNTGYEQKSTIVEDCATIGAAAVILPGICIGKGALVGAGAVVTKDVAAGTVVYGNPAKTRLAVEQGHALTKMLMDASHDRLKAFGWPRNKEGGFE